MSKLSVSSVIFLGLLLGGCGGSKSRSIDGSETPERRFFNPNNNQSGEPYFYDSETNKCLTLDGAEGRNHGVIGECGYVKEVTLSESNITTKDLRGMFFDHVNGDFLDFSSSDLKGAIIYGGSFEYADFSKSRLVNSILYKTKFGTSDFSDAAIIGVVADTDFSYATLNGAIFAESKFSLTESSDISVSMESSKFEGANYNNTTILPFSVYKGDHEYNMYNSSDIDKQLKSANGIPVSFEFDRLNDTKLKQYEATLVSQDIETFAKIKFKSGNLWFDKVFSKSGGNALRYVDDRFDYIISNIENDESNVVARNPTVPGYLVYLVYKASNASESDMKSLKKPVNDKDILLSSNFGGIMEIGPSYVKSVNDYVSRMTTLFHESRHGDCLQKPDGQKLLDEFSAGNKNVLVDFGKANSCGFFHAVCPTGHDMEGQLACDNDRWGAYAFEAIFTEKIAKDCESCTEFERQLALLEEKEAKSRVLKFEQLWNGDYGEPDLGMKVE